MPLESILLAAVGPRRSSTGEKGFADFMSKTVDRLAQDGLRRAAREEVRHQADEVRAGDARRSTSSNCHDSRRERSASVVRRAGILARGSDRGTADAARLGLVPLAARRDRHQSHDLLRRVRSRPLRRAASDDGEALGDLHRAERGDRHRRRVAAGLAAARHAHGRLLVHPVLPQHAAARAALLLLLRRRQPAEEPAPAAPLVTNVAWAIISLSFFAGRVQRRDLPLRHRGRAADDDRGRRIARLQPAADVPADRVAAGVSHQPAGAQQQPRQPRQDDHARVRDRRAGNAVRVEPDLVGRAQRAGDDERAADLLLRAGRRARLRACTGGSARCACRGSAYESLAARPDATGNVPTCRCCCPRHSASPRPRWPSELRGAPPLRLRSPRTAWRCSSLFLVGCGIAQAQVEAGHPSILGDALEMDAAAAARLRVQPRDQRRSRWRSGRSSACFLGFAQISLLPPVKRGAWLDDALLPQRAVAGAAVLLHVPAAVPGDGVRRDDPDSRLDQGDARTRAAGDGERVGDRARRDPVDPDRRNGNPPRRSRSTAGRRCG